MPITKRYTLAEIGGVKDSYSSNPGGSGFSSLGQVVFAMYCCSCGNATLLGQCVPGSTLIPWGICCFFNPYVSSACSQQCCVACTFSLGDSSTTYVALGSIGGCGATLWRRIT
jgi:hypothetical protein